MKKNTAGQVIGVQLVSKTDGSPVTSGTTTVYVTGDGGTQATGSVGSGACTHEGHGFWTYAPAQAETNYDHVAFTFENTNAVNATVQVYPTFPQTGDSFTRLGSPAGGSVSADVAAVKAETASIQSDTNDIQARVPAALVSGRMDSAIGAMAANTLTASALATDAVSEIQSGLATQSSVDDLPTNAELATALGAADDALLAQVALVKAKTDNLPPDPADASVIAQATGDILSAVATVDGAVDAIKLKTDNLPAAPAAVGDIPTADENADALLDRADAIETGMTLRQAQRVGLAVLAGKASGMATTTAIFRNTADTKNRITATVDQDGNRSAVVLDTS